MTAAGPQAGDRDGHRIAYVTCEPRQPQWDDDLLSIEPLRERGVAVEVAAWDDPEVDWESFDRVVVRSTWDYTARLGEFLAWCDRVGPQRLRNTPELIRWNSDKRYLAELDGGGLPVPPTLLVAPGGPVPELTGEVVAKPVIGGGARDTGRFRPEARPALLELLARIGERGEIAMLQPYLPEIETNGETAVLMFGGEFAYALNKRAFLEPDTVADAPDGVGAAEAMLDDDLVAAGNASPAELRLAEAVAGWLAGKFGDLPLYLRVDMLNTATGPVLMEVEAIEPSLYLGQTTGLERPGAELFADAVVEDLVRPPAGAGRPADPTE